MQVRNVVNVALRFSLKVGSSEKGVHYHTWGRKAGQMVLCKSKARSFVSSPYMQREEPDPITGWMSVVLRTHTALALTLENYYYGM